MIKTRNSCLAATIVLTLLPALVLAQEEGTTEEKKRERAQLLIHMNYLPELPSFNETAGLMQFLEQGSSSRIYSGGSGMAFEIGGIYAVRSRCSVGWSFEFLQAMQNGTLDVSAPHPLLFNQNRKASQSVNELSYSEFTIHTAFAYRIATERIEVDLFAGPSFFTTRAEVIDQATTDSQYPFDEISLTGISRVTLNDTAIGFNVGAGLAYYFTETLGISFLTRFSQADLEVMRDGGDPIAIKAGGFRVGGGIRIRF